MKNSNSEKKQSQRGRKQVQEISTASTQVKIEVVAEAPAPPSFPPESEILAKKVYPDRIVVVTKDGRKLIFPGMWEQGV